MVMVYDMSLDLSHTMISVNDRWNVSGKSLVVSVVGRTSKAVRNGFLFLLLRHTRRSSDEFWALL